MLGLSAYDTGLIAFGIHADEILTAPGGLFLDSYGYRVFSILTRDDDDILESAFGDDVSDSDEYADTVREGMVECFIGDVVGALPDSLTVGTDPVTGAPVILLAARSES